MHLVMPSMLTELCGSIGHHVGGRQGRDVYSCMSVGLSSCFLFVCLLISTRD